MAAITRDYGWIRKNGRLEGFLQRCLASEFGKVSWYEPCIVSSNYDKPAFRFVVITEERLYVTDNPPTEIMFCVRLGDVLSLNVINEYPEFLKGVERENVQHIKIISKDEEDRYLPSPVINRSVSQMSNLSYLEDPGSPCSSRSAEGSSTSEPSPDEKAKKWKWTRFLSFLLATKKKGCGLQTVIEDVDDGDIPQKVSLVDSEISSTKTNKKSFIRKLLLFSRYKARCEVEAETPPKVEEEDLVGNELRRPSFFTIYPENIKRPESVAHPFLSNTGGHDVTLRLSTPNQYEPHGRSLTALGNYADHKLVANKRQCRRSLFEDRENIPLFVTGGNTKKIPKQPTELDLYILTAQSMIFRHLVVAWNRILVRLTLHLENEQIYLNNNSTREHVEQILLEVCRKLNFTTEDDVIQLRISLESVQNELSKSSLARRMFWKDPHLFPTLVERLQNLFSSATLMPNPTIGVVMDRLKLGISMVAVLTTVLQEAQILPDRTHHLTIKNAQRSRELLATLVSEPEMLTSYRDTTLNVVTSHEQLLSKEWERMPEAPLIRSLIELTNVCTTALYQFVQLVYQENELITNQKTYGISWLVRILTDQQNLEKFLCRMMCQILLLATSSSNSTLTPSEAVLLHQQLAVLSTLVKYSPGVADHVHLNYAEEFRYYIFSHVIREKIPNEYPVRPNVLTLVEEVRNQVLDAKVSMNNSHLITAL